jgi:arylsulfatase A-like enzyme
MSRPPNLLFIFTDEQRFDTLACYGNAWLEMPNLNRLAERSYVFEEAYCAQPVCTPSRGSILTGLYPHAHGAVFNNVDLREDVKTLAEHLPVGAYDTGYFGKWHLGDEIFAQHGFERWESIEDEYRPWYTPKRDRGEHCTYYQWLRGKGLRPGNGDHFTRSEATRLPEKYGKPAFLGEKVSEFLLEPREKPFVAYVNFLEPHMPFFGPRDAQYNPKAIPLPENYDALPGPEQPLRVRQIFQKCHEEGEEGGPLRNEADWRRLRARYHGLCSLVDTHVGRILEALEASGQADNTLVVFTSDHGDQMGSHQLYGKSVQYQESIRIPLLVRLPGQREARRVRGPTSQVDLAPTLLEALGQPVPDGLHGKSRLAALRGAGPDGVQWDEEVVVCWAGDNQPERLEKLRRHPPQDLVEAVGGVEEALAALCDETLTLVDPAGWRYTWSRNGEHELYDLTRDRGERHNLARKAEHAGRMADYRARLRAWCERTNAPFEVTG